MFTVNQTHSERRFRDLDDDAIIVRFNRKQVLMLEGKALPRAADLRGAIAPDELLMLGGSMDGVQCWGIRDVSQQSHSSYIECRNVFLLPDNDIAFAVSRCRELAEWRQKHLFCGSCRARLELSRKDLALVCPECGAMYYPQIAPAVIVAITRDNGGEILLAHNRRFSDSIYSLIAGFVEAGESVEQAVRREIMEETGITVKNIRYLSSQPWPFPNSLMLAFEAEWESGEAKPDGSELVELGWFTKETLPTIPAPGSIAHKVITQFFNL